MHSARDNTLIALSLLAFGCGGAGTPATDGQAAVSVGGEANAETIPALPDATTAHPVALHRRAEVGQSSRETGVQTRRQYQRVLVGSRVVREETNESTLDFDISSVVLAVTEGGHAQLIEATIHRAHLRTNNGTSEVVPSGTVVRISRVPSSNSGEGTITGVDFTVSEEAADILDRVLSMSYSEHATDDVVFGSQTPRTIGETWPANHTKALQMLGSIPAISLDPNATVQGSTQLLRSLSVDGVPSLEFQYSLEAAGITLNGFPPGSEFLRSTFAVSARRSVPADPTLPEFGDLHDQMRMDMEILLPASQGGGRPLLQMRMEDSRDSQRRNQN